MPDPNVIELTCPAKVNLALSVGPPDANGMHPLASWMVALAFGDHLSIQRTDSSNTFDLAFDAAAPAPGTIDWPLERDLAFRAHRVMEAKTGRALPIAVTLRKRIPTGAGLGGGSSDAAAMMVAINRLFDLHIERDTLIAWSTELGSDVGFLIGAMTGSPSAIVTGTGQHIEPQPLNEVVHLVLIFPPFGCPTGAVYQALDEQRRDEDFAHLPDEKRVRDLALTSPVLQDAPFNDLAAPACAVQPRLGELLDQLREQLALPVHITGSGAAMFIIAPNGITAKALARKVTALAQLPAIATRTW